ncbi:signal transducer and activator of transcription 6 isoform X2 [Sceloporus undulatus]|uniref:signal transducer and activator of transcription 6 isoform X2 n=1 Tax=Sceloporus undulatus TaxID=8520 RepID=UPI001C4ACBAA|nr:signal transducer and activator of transcription 6 isoform X2 [Sceloporus undulatus]
MTNSKMSLWSLVSDMPPGRFSDLFEEFPHDLRCFLGDWLEAQPWEFISNISDSFCAVLAARLLSAMVEMLHDLANKNGSPGPILQLTANLENRYRREPLKLVEAVKRILREERAAIQEKFQHVPLFVHRQREELMFEFNLQRLQYRVQEIQALQERLEMNNSNTRVSLQLKMLDPQFPMQEKLHTSSLQNLQTLFLNTISELEEAKKAVLARLMIWKRQQQLAGNGTPFDEDLSPLQKRFERLVDICFQLRLQLVASGAELQSSLQERLDSVANALIKNSFLVDKQPPQVLKTQTKFQATVRFLLGPQLLKHPHTSFMVTADIVTEKQARELATSSSGGVFCESSGEIVNNTAPLETNATSNACCALFKSMLLKKIKRCDRKSTESVTEEKCAVLFSATVCLGPNKINFHLQALSLPIVVIVHGNQDNNAKATILWDNAFAAANRIPFVVAERVSWDDMCETLNQKFMAEVQTTKGLLKEHYFFLAQKIFGDSGASPEEFQKRPVSWSQFNKEILPGRGFTFWQWFEGVLDLTKKYLKEYWSDRLIIGFISKQYVFSCLSTAPVGTFLLRFSDSEIGGISIAYVTCFQDGSTQVENIQPFTAKQLSMRSLADCVLDLLQLQILYPDRPKHEAFKRHCNEAPRKSNYVPAKLKITVDLPSTFPAQSIQPQVDSMSNPNMNLGMHSDPPYDPSLMITPPRHMSPSGNTVYGSPQLQSEVTYSYSLGNASPLGQMDPYPMPPDVDMSDICMQNENTPMYATDLHMLPNQIVMPEMISPPSDEELALLLHSEQDLNRYSQDPA